MEKRAVIAVILSVLVMGIWLKLFPPQKKLPEEISKQEIQKKVTVVGETVKRKEIKAATEPVAEERQIREEGKDIIVQTDNILVSFSTIGGGIKDWSIKEKGAWTSLVLKEGESAPLDFYKEALFEANREKLVLDETYPQGEIIFTYISQGEDLSVVKTYKFEKDSYLVRLSIEITNNSKIQERIETFTLGWEAGIGPEEVSMKKGRGVRGIRPLLFIEEKIEKKIKIKDDEIKEYKGKIKWIGIDNSYFLIALIPQEKIFSKASIEIEENIPQVKTNTVFDLKPGETKNINLNIYLGPKEYNRLKKLGNNLEETIDFGFFGTIGKGVLFTLKFFYKITGNFGWSIVFLTMVLQVILLPLTMKSFKSMQSLKKIQPQINTLRENYKDDSKRLNVEMMNLYKTRKVNPFGGCLPMILQIPIFWALFTTLRNTVELRHAPFIFWIKDLSAYDPLYILPVLMGIVMFLQQKMTTTDPKQAKMVVFMPVIFVVLFLKFPAGLVLYWFVNNVLNLTMQLVIIKQSEKKEIVQVSK
ncbi:membrane protein insertase YidC [bacterium]|nr:membrane protein insertase YidC [bacterium]